jgi:hydroxypyruvate reductase
VSPLRDALSRALTAARLRLAAVGDFHGLGPEQSFDLIAIGKAASPMVDAALASHGEQLRAGLVVLPDDAPPPLIASSDGRVRVVRAAHPLPDARSVAAGEAALVLAREGEGSELRVLVSGGASSLAFAPVAGVSLESVREVTRALLMSGADVRATNVVRRHLSRVHGGGLARAAWPRSCVGAIVSDVIDGAAHDVGSGPAVADPTTVGDARAVLARYAPSFAALPLLETMKTHDPESARATCEIAFEPAHLARLLADELRRAGYTTRVLAPSTDDVESLADEYGRLARSLSPGEALVRSAEPSIRVVHAHPGAGGRCTHVAALVARVLPPETQFLAAASDGVDGTSETAGALVEARSFERARDALDAAIAAFDSGAFHRTHGTALSIGPTGLNFADVHALVRSRA